MERKDCYNLLYEGQTQRALHNRLLRMVLTLHFGFQKEDRLHFLASS